MNSPIKTETAYPLLQISQATGIAESVLSSLSEDGVIEIIEDSIGRKWLTEASIERIRTYHWACNSLGANHAGAECAVVLIEKIRELHDQLDEHRPKRPPVTIYC